MTKGLSDRTLREKAVPFEALPWSDSSNGDYGDTDAGTLADGVTQTCFIRCALPMIGNLVSAHLQLIQDVDSSLKVEVAIGRFEDDGVTPVTSYPDNYIENMSKLITGTDDGVESSGSTLLVDGVTLFPYLPKRGDAEFNEAGFLLILRYSRVPTVNEIIRRFAVLCSAEIGVV